MKITSLTSGGGPVSIVCSGTQTMEFSFSFIVFMLSDPNILATYFVPSCSILNLKKNFMACQRAN
jgi:hypothetical protein